MIDTIFDYAVAHSAVFGIGVIIVASSLSAAGIWAYGRFHGRATRRRGAGVIS